VRYGGLPELLSCFRRSKIQERRHIWILKKDVVENASVVVAVTAVAVAAHQVQRVASNNTLFVDHQQKTAGKITIHGLKPMVCER